jgi:hypothetical protein
VRFEQLREKTAQVKISNQISSSTGSCSLPDGKIDKPAPVIGLWDKKIGLVKNLIRFQI